MDCAARYPDAEGITAVLRSCARITLDEDDERRLGAAVDRVTDWSALPAAAEAHGLAPLVYSHLRRLSVPVPVEIDRLLLALTVRHRRANETRCRALRDVLDAFDAAGMDAIVLKGAALANLLYPSIALRPMSDIDLLVDGSVAVRAQCVLTQCGFHAPSAATSPRLVAHHHLPPATRTDGGVAVQVEVHRNALSRDVAATLTIRQLSAPPREFDLCGRTARTLNHADMLHHLCRHTAERASVLKLIWIADVMGYASRFAHEIDWAALRRRYPFVMAALAQLHHVIPLPASVALQVGADTTAPPCGVGVPCAPLSSALRRGRPLRDIAVDVLSPSEWWVRLHYGVAPSRSLSWHRCVVHPLNVARWMCRRIGTFTRWRLGFAR